MASINEQHVQQLLAAAVAACEAKKGEDIRILSLDPTESGLTDYFLICTGNNDRQNVAITDEIEFRLKHDFGTYPTSVEGRRQGDWILMDYVDFIIHIFSPEKRAFYGLERLRKSAKVLSIEDLNAEIKNAIATSRSKSVSSMAKSAVRKEVSTSTLPKKTGRTKKTLLVEKEVTTKTPLQRG